MKIKFSFRKLASFYISLVIIVAFAILQPSCSRDLTSARHYKLTVVAENGTVNISPDKAKYAEGETVTLTPAPSPGYDFKAFNEENEWGVTISAGGKNHAYVMDQDRVITAVFIPIPSSPPVYYIDFDNGLDANTGTSESTPWKHAPGDTNAAGIPAGITLTPGSKLRFKGGVTYRGSIKLRQDENGSLNYPVKFSGNSWPAGTKAIIDGADLIPGWTHCTSAAECYGNENYNNIYYATVTGDYDPLKLNLHELNPSTGDDEYLWVSQYPVPTDEQQYFHETAPKYKQDSYTLSSITDADVFNQDDPEYWKEAHVLVWIYANLVSYRKIDSFIPSTHTIGFDKIDTQSFIDYAIYNSPKHITRPGRYSVVETGSNEYRVFLWPRNTANLQGRISFSTREHGIDTYINSNIIIDGFIVRKCSKDAIGSIEGDSNPKGNITITNCRIEHNNSGASIRLENVTGSLIEKNEVVDNRFGAGIQVVRSRDVIVKNNLVSRTSTSSIRFYTVENSQILGNTIEKCNGTHGNGITLYIGSYNILVANNKVHDSDSCLAFADSGNIYIINNFIDGILIDEWLSRDPLHVHGEIMFLNNTFVKNIIGIYLTPENNYTIVNNIAPGLAKPAQVRHHNLYTTKYWSQQQADFPYITGEFVAEDLTAIFTNPSGGDYTLKTGSPAIGAGVDINNYFPSETFPGYDFNSDINGTKRNGWDLGAYTH